MRRYLLLAVMVCVALSAKAQYSRDDFSLTTATGQAVSGAQVYVLGQPANTTAFTPLATLFGSPTGAGSTSCGESGGQIANPLTTDQFGHACAYATPGTYTVCYVSNRTGMQCYPDQAFNGSGSGAFSGPVSTPLLLAEQVGTYYYVDGFPSSCNVGGNAYTTQLDCAWQTALSTIPAATTNPTVILGTNAYTTCAGLQMVPSGYMGENSVNLVSMSAQMNDPFFGFQTPPTVRQTCGISTGTLYLPQTVGAGFKHNVVEGVSIDANKLAPYAMQILGASDNSIIKQIQASNGTTGTIILGVQFQESGTLQSLDMEDIQTFDICTTGGDHCGSGAVVGVSLTGGVPSFSVTSGGTNYDGNTIAQLVGFQGGTSNQPCTSMGTTTPVISGGAVTGVTSTATGCSGNVYLALSDVGTALYGIEFDNVTDTNNIQGLNIQNGRTAGFFCKGCGNVFAYGVHAWGGGFYGIQNGTGSSATFIATDCGENSIACFDNQGNGTTSTIIGGTFFTTLQVAGYSLMRNDGSTARFKAVNFFCQNHQTAEAHTLSNTTGTVDTSEQLITSDYLEDMEYCGSGAGSTIYATTGDRVVRGTVTSNHTVFFSAASLTCMAQSEEGAPLISGSVITYPGDGAHNGGSVVCTSPTGLNTLQSVPSTGGGSQTFDVSSQFALGGGSWLQMSNAGQINLSGPITVANGSLHSIGGGSITATTTNGANTVFRCLTAGAVLPAGSLTITAAACGTSISTGFPVN